MALNVDRGSGSARAFSPRGFKLLRPRCLSLPSDPTSNQPSPLSILHSFPGVGSNISYMKKPSPFTILCGLTPRVSNDFNTVNFVER